MLGNGLSSDVVVLLIPLILLLILLLLALLLGFAVVRGVEGDPHVAIEVERE